MRSGPPEEELDEDGLPRRRPGETESEWETRLLLRIPGARERLLERSAQAARGETIALEELGGKKPDAAE
jgi:hypothetical protein